MAVIVGVGVTLGASIELRKRRDQFERARRTHAAAEYAAAAMIDFFLGTLMTPPIAGILPPMPSRESIAEGFHLDPPAIEQLAIHQDEGLTWADPVKQLGLPVGTRPSINLEEVQGYDWLTPALHREAYHRRMRLKYDRAMHDPWLPVEPDPPAPP